MHLGAWDVVALSAIRCQECCPFTLRIGQPVCRHAKRDYNLLDIFSPFSSRAAVEIKKHSQGRYQTQKFLIHDPSPINFAIANRATAEIAMLRPAWISNAPFALRGWKSVPPPAGRSLRPARARR